MLDAFIIDKMKKEQEREKLEKEPPSITIPVEIDPEGPPKQLKKQITIQF